MAEIITHLFEEDRTPCPYCGLRMKYKRLREKHIKECKKKYDKTISNICKMADKLNW